MPKTPQDLIRQGREDLEVIPVCLAPVGATTMKWLLIERGKAGWHAYAPNVTSSGGSLEMYQSEAAEGCILVDAENVPQLAFEAHVYRGPMVNVALPKGHARQPLGQPFKTTARRKFGSLDYVALNIYVALCRRLPGIKIATRNNKGNS